MKRSRFQVGDDERPGCRSPTEGQGHRGRLAGEDRWGWVSTPEEGTPPAHQQGAIMPVFIICAVSVLARLNRSWLVTCLSPHLVVRRTEKKFKTWTQPGGAPRLKNCWSVAWHWLISAYITLQLSLWPLMFSLIFSHILSIFSYLSLRLLLQSSQKCQMCSTLRGEQKKKLHLDCIYCSLLFRLLLLSPCFFLPRPYFSCPGTPSSIHLYSRLSIGVFCYMWNINLP